MLKFGEEPFLECSSKGDKRFSAFHARIKEGPNVSSVFINKSIEEIYQGQKLIDGRTGWTWKEVKGKKAENQEELKELYGRLWDFYFIQNPELLEVIKQYRGFSDIFGQKGHACQAEEIYRIRMLHDA